MRNIRLDNVLDDDANLQSKYGAVREDERQEQMNIGIDAQVFCRPQTGIERYALEVLKEMLDQRPDVTFYLYSSKKPILPITESKQLIFRHGSFRNKLAGYFFLQCMIPFWARKDKLDAFWGPAHRLPIFLSNNIQKVVTIHDMTWRAAPETMRKAGYLSEYLLMPYAIHRSNCILAVSKSTACSIVEEYPEAESKVFLSPLGVTKFPEVTGRELLTALGIRSQYFLFVGTIEPRKNLERLLMAYATLEEHVRNQCILVIAGGAGWGRIRIEEICKRLGIERFVHITGYVSEEALATLYQYAEFLTMPSLYEGFGLPLLEAMSFGVPVITSNISSMPEVAGKAGLLVDPMDVDSIALALETMIVDEAFRKDLGSRARAQAAQFSWGYTAKATLKALDRTVTAVQGESL